MTEQQSRKPAIRPDEGTTHASPSSPSGMARVYRFGTRPALILSDLEERFLESPVDPFTEKSDPAMGLEENFYSQQASILRELNRMYLYGLYRDPKMSQRLVELRVAGIISTNPQVKWGEAYREATRQIVVTRDPSLALPTPPPPPPPITPEAIRALSPSGFVVESPEGVRRVASIHEVASLFKVNRAFYEGFAGRLTDLLNAIRNTPLYEKIVKAFGVQPMEYGGKIWGFQRTLEMTMPSPVGLESTGPGLIERIARFLRSEYERMSRLGITASTIPEEPPPPDWFLRLSKEPPSYSLTRELEARYGGYTVGPVGRPGSYRESPLYQRYSQLFRRSPQRFAEVISRYASALHLLGYRPKMGIYDNPQESDRAFAEWLLSLPERMREPVLRMRYGLIFQMREMGHAYRESLYYRWRIGKWAPSHQESRASRPWGSLRMPPRSEADMPPSAARVMETLGVKPEDIEKIASGSSLSEEELERALALEGDMFLVLKPSVASSIIRPESRPPDPMGTPFPPGPVHIPPDLLPKAPASVLREPEPMGTGNTPPHGSPIDWGWSETGRSGMINPRRAVPSQPPSDMYRDISVGDLVERYGQVYKVARVIDSATGPSFELEGEGGHRIIAQAREVHPYSPATRPSVPTWPRYVPPSPTRAKPEAWSPLPFRGRGIPWVDIKSRGEEWGYIQRALLGVHETLPTFAGLQENLAGYVDVLAQRVQRLEAERPTGLISRIARGREYNLRLEEVREFIRSLEAMAAAVKESRAELVEHTKVLREQKGILIREIGSMEQRLRMISGKPGKEEDIKQLQEEIPKARYQLEQISAALADVSAEEVALGRTMARIASAKAAIRSMAIHPGSWLERVAAEWQGNLGWQLFNISMAQWYALSPLTDILRAYAGIQRSALGAAYYAGYPVGEIGGAYGGILGASAQWTRLMEGLGSGTYTNLSPILNLLAGAGDQGAYNLGKILSPITTGVLLGILTRFLGGLLGSRSLAAPSLIGALAGRVGAEKIGAEMGDTTGIRIDKAVTDIIIGAAATKLLGNRILRPVGDILRKAGPLGRIGAFLLERSPLLVGAGMGLYELITPSEESLIRSLSRAGEWAMEHIPAPIREAAQESIPLIAPHIAPVATGVGTAIGTRIITDAMGIKGRWGKIIPIAAGLGSAAYEYITSPGDNVLKRLIRRGADMLGVEIPWIESGKELSSPSLSSIEPIEPILRGLDVAISVESGGWALSRAAQVASKLVGRVGHVGRWIAGGLDLAGTRIAKVSPILAVTLGAYKALSEYANAPGSSPVQQATRILLNAPKFALDMIDLNASYILGQIGQQEAIQGISDLVRKHYGPGWYENLIRKVAGLPAPSASPEIAPYQPPSSVMERLGKLWDVITHPSYWFRPPAPERPSQLPHYLPLPELREPISKPTKPMGPDRDQLPYYLPLPSLRLPGRGTTPEYKEPPSHFQYYFRPASQPATLGEMLMEPFRERVAPIARTVSRVVSGGFPSLKERLMEEANLAAPGVLPILESAAEGSVASSVSRIALGLLGATGPTGRMLSTGIGIGYAIYRYATSSEDDILKRAIRQASLAERYSQASEYLQDVPALRPPYPGEERYLAQRAPSQPSGIAQWISDRILSPVSGAVVEAFRWITSPLRRRERQATYPDESRYLAIPPSVFGRVRRRKAPGHPMEVWATRHPDIEDGGVSPQSLAYPDESRYLAIPAPPTATGEPPYLSQLRLAVTKAGIPLTTIYGGGEQERYRTLQILAATTGLDIYSPSELRKARAILRNIELDIARGGTGMSAVEIPQRILELLGYSQYSPGYIELLSQYSEMPYRRRLQVLEGLEFVSRYRIPETLLGRAAGLYERMISLGMTTGQIARQFNYAFSMEPVWYSARMIGLFGGPAIDPSRRLYDFVQVPGGGLAVYSRGALEARAAESAFMAGQRAYILQGLSADLSRLQWAAGVTRQEWAIQDRIIAANRGYQMTMLDIAQAELSIQRRMWEARVRFERRQAEEERAMALRQRQWWREDFALQEQVAGLQYAWEREDILRAIRYSTGVDRRQLQRRLERLDIMYSIQETQRDRARERQEELWRFEDRRYREGRKFQEDMIREQRRLWDLQSRRLAAQRAHLMEQWALEDKLRQLQREEQEQQWKFREEDIQRQKEYYEKILWPYQDETMRRQREIEDAWAKYQGDMIMSLSPDGPMYRAFYKMIENWISILEDARDMKLTEQPRNPSGEFRRLVNESLRRDQGVRPRRGGVPIPY